MDKPTLILDADDTLWENNIFYEQATDAFADLMTQEGFDWNDSRQAFEQVERERVPEVGYAPHEFARSMVITYQRICQEHGRQPNAQIETAAEAIGLRVVDYPINLFEGVRETLDQLRDHYRLLMLTKGDQKEQQSKIDRSGLAHFFEAIHIVPEKGPEVFHDLLNNYSLDPQQTWMVGNSPRSDINPALQAGIRAVYIPYEMTWSYEQAPLAETENVRVVKRFPDLLQLFPTQNDVGD
jgi:putative hydrolase of the HAD superfamily